MSSALVRTPNWPAPVFAPSGAKPAAPNPVNLELAPEPEQTHMLDAPLAIVAAPAAIAEPKPGLFVVDVRGSKACDGAHLIPVNRYRQVAAALETALR